MISFRSLKAAFASLMIVAALTIGFSPQAHAQIYAAIHGTVTDSTGAVVQNATVQAVNTSTGIVTTVKSNGSGYYILPQLQIGGPYSISIAAPKFQTSSTEGLILALNDNRAVDAKLKVGAESMSVIVSATALQVETSDTQMKQIVTAGQLVGVPLVGRDAAGLQKLSPGNVESSDRMGNYSSNGNQTTQNSYLLNGADINDGALQTEGLSVNPDALQEVNIVTSTMNPEFARNSGAVINEVLKSGTNSLHGSGFEFYRDTFMNNGDYFSKKRPVFHQNLFGGTLGGPVIKNKLFFFLAYQGNRHRTGRTKRPVTMSGTKGGTTPTGQFGGDFSTDENYKQQFTPNNTPFDNTLIDPGTGQIPCPNIPSKIYSNSLSCSPTPFSVNGAAAGTPWIVAFDGSPIDIPNSTWNPVATALINTYVPQANDLSDGTPRYNFNEARTGAEDQGIVRLDFTPTSSDSIWASTIFESSPSTDALAFGGSSFPGSGMVNASHTKVFTTSWTHSFSANKLNELRAGYYRLNYASVTPAQIIPPSSVGFSINPQLALQGLPYMAVGSYFNLGFSFEGPQPRIDSNATYADNFTWIKGNHALKFGASFEQFRVHNPFGSDNNGNFGFNGGGTYTSGDPLIDLVLGIPDTYAQTNNGFIDAVATEMYGYVQDNWKATPNLTVNYGLAWDAEQPNQNRQFGGLGIICWQATNATSRVYAGAPPGLFYKGDPGCNEAGGPTTKYNRFGPRFGFAWSPSTGPSAVIGRPGSHDFSIRGAFGVYYNRDQEEQSLQNLSDPPVYYTSHGAGDFGGSPAFANPFNDVAGNGSETNPFPFNTPKPGQAVNWSIYNQLDLAAFDKNYSVPYTYNFNLNIQRSLGATMVLQIGYVGSVSHRLSTWYEGDAITPAGHAACLANPACAGNAQLVHILFPQYTVQPATAAPGIPWYASVGMQNSEGSSNYNSLQVSLIKAESHGLQFTTAYTYSHALDDGSGYESATGGDAGYGGYGRVRNFVPGYQNLNYGSSDFDARHRFVASYVYTVPVVGFMRTNLILRELLSGWGIGGVSAFQTGNPVGISLGTQNSLWCDAYSYFGCPDVPNTNSFHIKTYDPRAAGHKYFDTAPFSAEQVGTFGNTTRNFFHGPGFNYTNLQLSKNIPLGADGARYIQLRIEAFNAFNHANFQAPSGNYSDPGFGKITSVVHSADANADPQPGRVLQLAGKLFF